MNSTALAYRTTAVAGASGFGLMIALYDTLAGDLRRAAQAERDNDIEKRCLEANHAALVLAHLEDWVDSEGGGELSHKLIGFYASMRRSLIEAQARRSVEILEQQIALVLNLREAWQDMELRGTGSSEAPPYAGAQSCSVSGSAQDEATTTSWAA